MKILITILFLCFAFTANGQKTDSVHETCTTKAEDFPAIRGYRLGIELLKPTIPVTGKLTETELTKGVIINSLDSF